MQLLTPDRTLVYQQQQNYDNLGWIDLEKLRVPGVLQRFGITYFIVATTGVIFMESFEPKLAENSKWNAIKDCFSLWQRWIVAALVTILHCLLTFALPVPGCPTGIQSLLKTKAKFFQVRF